MTDYEALLAAIRTHPDEDTPRLALADWLDENDQPERAEFIKVQVELARRIPKDDRRVAEGDRETIDMLERAAQLFADHGETWVRQDLGNLRHALNSYGYHRGFIDEIHIKPKRLIAHHEEIFARCPVKEIQLYQPRHRPPEEPINDHNNDISRRDMERIMSLPELRNITHLTIHTAALDSGSASLIARSPHLRNLKVLDLRWNNIGSQGLRHLAESPYLANLERLILQCNDIRTEGVEALAHSQHMRGLKELELVGNPIQDWDIEAIANSPNFVQLEHLGLCQINVGSETAKQLLTSPHLHKLKSLKIGYMGESGHNDELMTMLGRSTQFKDLERLDT